MSWCRSALMTVPPLLAFLSVVPTPAATPAVDPGAFAHCMSITAADERLACYDSLGQPKPSPPPAATHTAGAATTTGAAAAPHAAAAGATTAAAAAAVTPDEKSFGLGTHPRPVEQGPDRIQAKVTNYNMDRLGNVRVALDNGQTWTFTATDALLRVGDEVTIKRAALGSFLLTTPSHHTYRVVRAQ